MLFFALGRALLNRVSRQTRLRKNPFILLTLEVSSEHIWTRIRRHFAYRTLKQITKNLPLINLRPMQYPERIHHWPVFGHHGFHVLVHFGHLAYRPRTNLQSYSKTGNNNVELFLQNCRRTCWKGMLRFLTPPFKPVLKQVKVAACCANTDFLLDKITLESRHTRELRNLLQNKFALDR